VSRLDEIWDSGLTQTWPAWLEVPTTRRPTPYGLAMAERELAIRGRIIRRLNISSSKRHRDGYDHEAISIDAGIRAGDVAAKIETTLKLVAKGEMGVHRAHRLNRPRQFAVSYLLAKEQRADRIYQKREAERERVRAEEAAAEARRARWA